MRGHLGVCQVADADLLARLDGDQGPHLHTPVSVLWWGQGLACEPSNRATLASDDEMYRDLDWLGVGEARVVDVGEDWVESHEAAALVRVEAEAVDQ